MIGCVMTDQTDVGLEHVLKDLFPGTTDAKWGKVLREVFDERALPFQDAYKGNVFEYAAAALLGMLQGRDLPVIGTQTKRADIQNAAKTVPVAYDFSKNDDSRLAYINNVLSPIFSSVSRHSPNNSEKPVIIFTDNASRTAATFQRLPDRPHDRFNQAMGRPLVVQMTDRPASWELWQFPLDREGRISFEQVYQAALKLYMVGHVKRPPNEAKKDTIYFDYNGLSLRAQRHYHEGDCVRNYFEQGINARPDFSFLLPETKKEREVQENYLPHLVMATVFSTSLAIAFRDVGKVSEEALNAKQEMPVPYGYHSMFSGGVSPDKDSVAPYVVGGQSIRDVLLDDKQKIIADQAIRSLYTLLDVENYLNTLKSSRFFSNQDAHRDYLVKQCLEIISVYYAMQPDALEMNEIRQAIDILSLD